MPSDEGSKPAPNVQEGGGVIEKAKGGGPGYIPKAIIAEESFWLDEEADLDSKWPGRIYRSKPMIGKFWT